MNINSKFSVFISIVCFASAIIGISAFFMSTPTLKDVMTFFSKDPIIDTLTKKYEKDRQETIDSITKKEKRSPIIKEDKPLEKIKKTNKKKESIDYKPNLEEINFEYNTSEQKKYKPNLKKMK